MVKWSCPSSLPAIGALSAAILALCIDPTDASAQIIEVNRLDAGFADGRALPVFTFQLIWGTGLKVVPGPSAKFDPVDWRLPLGSPFFDDDVIEKPGVSDANGGGRNVSRNGQGFVGYLDNGFFTPYHGFYAAGGGDPIDLGTLDPANNATRESFAVDVTDGGTVVGYSDAAGDVQHAFRWTQAAGMVDLGTGGGGDSPTSRALGVSADGSVIVGDSHFEDGFFAVTKAARWTAAGIQSLGQVQPFGSSTASAVTADGSVIVGQAAISVTIGGANVSRGHAMRWTEAGGMQDLGVLPGDQASAATGVSDDGSIVVGISAPRPLSNLASPGGRFDFGADTRAFYWTAATGMQDLTQLLQAGGANAGVTMVAANGISADGVWIGGAAVTPSTEGNATHPAFASLTASLPNSDFLDDGEINAADLAKWRTGFGQFDGAATLATHADGDADGDRDVDGADFLVWQQQLGASQSAQAAATAVPEPSLMAPLVAVLVVIGAMPRRPIRIPQ